MARSSSGSSDVWPVVDPSTFIHRITFLDQVQGFDASGAVVSYAAGSPPDVTYGRIKLVSGRDVIKGGQDTSQLFAEVTTYYRAGRGPNTRILTPSGSVFIVRSVANLDERNMFTVFNCVGLGANE